MPEQTQPFTILYLCPECGYWFVSNTLMEALAQIGEPIKCVCPHDNAELVKVKPDDRLAQRTDAA